MDQSSLSPVRNFYSNKSIFITGATGFIGKVRIVCFNFCKKINQLSMLIQVLVEKLLFECPDLKKIYLLLRSKNGQNVKARLEEFFTCTFFQNCGRVTEATLRTKVEAVVGDITLPNLGLSIEDRQTLIDHVNIVFHSAASVKFDDPLK